MPKISVIIPVYNVENCLERCIESVTNQTERDLEIILVDDGSKDKSSELCDSYKEKDDRIKVIHKSNGGLASARLAGFQTAKGDYISFIDSDDYISLNMYEKMFSAITDAHADISLCSYYFVEGNNTIEKHQPIKPGIYDKEEIKSNFLERMAGRASWGNEDYIKGFMWLKLYKRSLVQQNWFLSERIYFAEDVVFNINAFANARRIAVINDCLYYYVYSGSSLSNKYRDGLWDMYKRLYQYLCNFYKELGMLDIVELRLSNALTGMALGSFNNIAKKTNKEIIAKKISKIKSILNDAEVKRAIKSQTEDKNILRRMYYKCIDNGWPVLILLISKIHMRIRSI